MRNRLERLVGLVVLGVTGLAAVLLWLAVARSDPARHSTRDGALFGIWEVLYDTQAPSTRVLLIAISISLLCAAGLALLEHRIITAARRSTNAAGTPLAPRVVMARTRGRFDGE